MKRLKIFTIMVFVVCLTAASASAAEIIFYENTNFLGSSLVLRPGDNAPDLSSLVTPAGSTWLNRISSVKVIGDIQANVYTNPHFKGSSRKVTGSIRDFSTTPGWQRFADQIASIRVHGTPQAEPGTPVPGKPTPQPTQEDTPSAPPPAVTSSGGSYVVLYEKKNYQGESLTLNADTRVKCLCDYYRDSGQDWNDKVSSMRIFGNLRIHMFEHPNYQGTNHLISHSYRDFRVEPLNNYNNKLSSLIVYPGVEVESNPHVVLYENPNYTGKHLVMWPGESIAALGDQYDTEGRNWNDRFSSIAIYGNLRVDLAADPGFRGKEESVRISIPDFAKSPSLGNLNNSVSSVRVRKQ